jgi:hypothetical protein
MGWNYIPVPDGFFVYTPGPNPYLNPLDKIHRENSSYIKWQSIIWVYENSGPGGVTTHRQAPPTTGKVRDRVTRNADGGIIRIEIDVDYKLTRLLEGPIPFPEVIEIGSFWCACDWPYSFSQQNYLVFGPHQSILPLRNANLLQCLFVDVQEKDQIQPTPDPKQTGLRPYAFAVPVLSLRSKPGEHQGWSLQAPVVGGPSYTPPGLGPTPDGNFRLANYTIELDVAVPTFTPIVEIKLKPLSFIQLFYTDNKNDDDIKKNDDIVALMKWVSAIKTSELYPVIKNGYLPIHIEGHASKTGSDLVNFDLSQKRRENVQKRFKGMINANPVIIVEDRGNQDASQVNLPPNQRNEGYLKDRYVKIEIKEDEAKSALLRYYKEGGR